jgi:hypothetical protein
MNKLLNVSLAIAGLVLIAACGSVDPKGAVNQKTAKINQLVDLGMKFAANHANKANLAANKAKVEDAMRAHFGRCNDADHEILSKYLKEEISGPAWSNGLSSDCQKSHNEMIESFKKFKL